MREFSRQVQRQSSESDLSSADTGCAEGVHISSRPAAVIEDLDGEMWAATRSSSAPTCRPVAYEVVDGRKTRTSLSKAPQRACIASYFSPSSHHVRLSSTTTVSSSSSRPSTARSSYSQCARSIGGTVCTTSSATDEDAGPTSGPMRGQLMLARYTASLPADEVREVCCTSPHCRSARGQPTHPHTTHATGRRHARSLQDKPAGISADLSLCGSSPARSHHHHSDSPSFCSGTAQQSAASRSVVGANTVLARRVAHYNRMPSPAYRTTANRAQELFKSDPPHVQEEPRAHIQYMYSAHTDVDVHAHARAAA